MLVVNPCIYNDLGARRHLGSTTLAPRPTTGSEAKSAGRRGKARVLPLLQSRCRELCLDRRFDLLAGYVCADRLDETAIAEGTDSHEAGHILSARHTRPHAGDAERGRPVWRAAGASTRWGCSAAGPATAGHRQCAAERKKKQPAYTRGYRRSWTTRVPGVLSRASGD